MIDYSTHEILLIEKIASKGLKNSLAQIRESAEAIWSNEAPRIIQGFTDHGFDHCLRLINYASQLLCANKGTSLADEEIYLLIAGIYLHDIGMQCDVSKFPLIKEKAAEFGANFKIEFTNTNASQYSQTEQIEIRKNHQYLSAAWIDIAFRTSETALGKSIQSVPNEILLDLIEICKYHSKLNILECPLQFTISTKGRKQFIAALVRFSDELDVDKNRVSIETVMNFSMEPQNAYYWWLHHLTKIEINDNVLVLRVRLNPADYVSYSSFINETYIEQFRKKNKPVLDILNNNSIPIFISSESEAVSYTYAPKLPGEIVKAIQEIQSKIAIEKSTFIADTKQLPRNQLNSFPKPKPYFAGRETELKDLKVAFEKSPFIFIEGGGGIGKTQFVAKLIEDQGFTDKVVWYECIPTSQPDDIINGAGFEELLKGKEKTEREKFSAFKDKIEEYDLVVFLDNYQEVESIPAFKSFLSFINEYLRKGHIIVLGRDNIITPQLQLKRIQIKGLGEDSLLHAQGLIQYSYPDLIQTPKKDLETLCEKLKGYPLAVDLAIYLLSLNVTVENILDVAVTEAQSEGSEIEKISNRLLNEIFIRPDASEDEREFLKLLSIFRGKIQDKEAMSVIPQEIFKTASRKLINRNLLEINGDYLELHPLIREFCYTELLNKKEIHNKAAKYYIEQRTKHWNPELEEKIYYHLYCSEKWLDISITIIEFGREFIIHGYLDRLQQMITLVQHQNIFEPKFDIYDGDIAEIKGNWDLALSIFDKAKQSINEEVKIEGIIKYGEMLYRKGNVKKAQSFFDEALTITKNNSHEKWYARALNDLGIVNIYDGNNNSALNLYTDALQIRQKLENQEDIAATLNNIACVKEVLGEIEDALIFNERSLKIRKEIEDKQGIANSLNNIGALKSKLYLFDQALEYYNMSLEIHQEIGAKSGIGVNFNNIGRIKYDLGLKSEALEFYEKSLKIDKEIGNKSGIASGLNNIGYVKMESGSLKEALDLCNQGLVINEDIGNKSGIADCLSNIAIIYNKLGLKKQALESYEKCLKINEEIGRKYNTAISLSNLGSFLIHHDGDLEIACFYLLKSLALNKLMSMKDQKNILGEIVTLRQKLGIIKFKDIVFMCLDKLDIALKELIDPNEILGEPIKVEKKPERNDPCPCGSGKKFKNCHGK